jgi:hypothetical protein
MHWISSGIERRGGEVVELRNVVPIHVNEGVVAGMGRYFMK